VIILQWQFSQDDRKEFQIPSPYSPGNGVAWHFFAERSSALGALTSSAAKWAATSRGSRKRTAWGMGPGPDGKSISASERSFDYVDCVLSSMP
jgi:hypothetical protein